MKNFIRGLIFSNFYVQIIVSYLFVFFYFFSNKNKINIKYINNYWIHETYLGKFAYSYPIRKAEEALIKEMPFFTKFYNIQKGDIVFDAGAGIGTEVIFFSKLVGKSGKVYALEANPNIYKLLLRTIKINNLQNIIPINLAVYKISDKKLKFEADEKYWLSGKINNEKGSIIVKSISFDDLLIKLNIPKINFAKFNIEGAEKYLITGEQKFIQKCKNVCIACHDFLEDKNLHTFVNIKKMLKKNKFKIFKNNAILKKYQVDKKYYVYAQKK